MKTRVMKFNDAKVREDNGRRYIEGYFSVFNEPYQIFPGWIEMIAPGAFARYLAQGKDVKVLWNHDANIVLGSTGNGTAVLREDEKGLWGCVEINGNDHDAVNAYARVERGDVDGCSFGFDVKDMDEWWDENGVYHTLIKEVDPLYEVSPCTFPAYEATSISARAKVEMEAAKKKFEESKEKRMKEWKDSVLAKMKGEQHGT